MTFLGRLWPRHVVASLALGLLLLTFPLLCGCSRDNLPPEAAESEEMPAAVPLNLSYLGHAAFWVENDVTILMDPYNPDTGYGQINIPADLVTISHNHFDHNYAEGGPGAIVLSGLDEGGEWREIQHQDAGLNIYTVPVYHDKRHGSWLGKNSIFVVETGGMRLVHLGDLGHTLSDSEKELIGPADILIVPVGGHYTLGAEDMLQVIDLLSPAVVIPVHYRTKHYPEMNLSTLDDFLNLDLPYPVMYKESSVRLAKDSLPAAPEIWVMEYRMPR